MGATADSSVELPFIGRDREMAELGRLTSGSDLPSAAIIVKGPAGIGKTRLVREYLRSQENSLAFWESCRQTAQFGPWTRIARQWTGSPTRSLAEIAFGGSTFAAARSDLVEAAVDFFCERIDARRFTIVLDDLHDADADTLLLTRAIIAQLDPNHALIIATVRAEPGEASLLAVAPELTLGGLSVGAVQELLGSSDIASRVQDRTKGNPLHLERLLRRREIDNSSPLTELLTRQIGELDDDAHAIVVALAVFDVPVDRARLARVVRMPDDAVDRGLRSLREGELVDGVGDSQELLELHHGLIGTVVLERTDQETLRDHHQRVADEFAREPASLQIWSHHVLGALGSNSDEVVREHLTAGRAAERALAAEEAAEQFELAASVLRELTIPTTELVVETHLALSVARARRDPVGAAAALNEAWVAAISSRDPVAIARAALGDDFRFEFASDRDAERARRCERGLENESELSPALRARLHATLACHSLGQDTVTNARHHAVAALDLAEDSADAYSIGCALVAWIVTDLDPDTLDERLGAARRVSALAESTGAIDLARNAHFLLMACLVERGDVRAVDAELASRHRRSISFAELENGRHSGWFRCMRAILDGRIDDAEHLSLIALQAAQQEGDPDALPVHVGQLGIIRWMQGRESEIEQHYAAARAHQPHDAVWIAVLARLWALSGRTDAAIGALESLGDLTDIARDRNWLITMTTAAEAAAIVGDSPLLPVLRELLLPYVGRLVPIGLGIACWGTVARPLALVSMAMGRFAEAEQLLRSAIHSGSVAGAQPWIAQAQLDLAAVLEGQGSDSAETDRLVHSALTTARGLGIVPLRESAERIVARRGSREITRPVDATTRAESPLISVLGTFAVVGANGEQAS